MINGTLLISLKILTILISIIFFNSILFANEVQISPLINLDQISPSFEDLDEESIPQKNRGELDDNFENDKVDLEFVLINVLNKITARVDIVEIQIKENFIYEDLRVYPIHCTISDPTQKAETSVYLKIYSNIDDKMLFSGWMLKSLPSISSLEHPLYDIWINECI